MKKIIITLSMTIGFITIGFCDEPPPFNPDVPSSIPIDGGVFALLGVGVGYGLKKIKEKNTNS